MFMHMCMRDVREVRPVQLTLVWRAFLAAYLGDLDQDLHNRTQVDRHTRVAQPLVEDALLHGVPQGCPTVPHRGRSIREMSV